MGFCTKCGKCCVLILELKCPFLKKDNTGGVYRFRPFFLCRLPPLNLSKPEVERFKKYNCGYYWTEK